MNKNNPALWGIKNLSDSVWKFTAEGKETKDIAKGSVIPVANNVKIAFENIEAKISK